MSPEVRYLLESLATVAVFGAALAVAVFGVRRLGIASARGPLEIVARQPLDGRRAIYLVRVGERVLIVGATDASLTRLGSTSVDALRRAAPQAEIDPARAWGDEPSRSSQPGAATPSGRFRDVLSRALGRSKA